MRENRQYIIIYNNYEAVTVEIDISDLLSFMFKAGVVRPIDLFIDPEYAPLKIYGGGLKRPIILKEKENN